jgi:4'-phosphopantetheinyl transferase
MRWLVRPFPTSPADLVAASEVSVWSARLDAPPVPAADLLAALTPEERARGERLRHPRVRDQFTRARGLLRVLLGRYLGCAPGSVPILLAPDGKPVLEGGALEFNVSHTEGLALFAVADRPVGVDVEAVRDVPNADSLVERFFSPAEREQYRALPAALRPAAFLRGWTCKEAVLKGLGCGTRELDRCVVDLDSRRPAAIVGPAATAVEWAIAAGEPEPGYVGAIASSKFQVPSSKHET